MVTKNIQFNWAEIQNVFETLEFCNHDFFEILPQVKIQPTLKEVYILENILIAN